MRKWHPYPPMCIFCTFHFVGMYPCKQRLCPYFVRLDFVILPAGCRGRWGGAALRCLPCQSVRFRYAFSCKKVDFVGIRCRVRVSV